MLKLAVACVLAGLCACGCDWNSMEARFFRGSRSTQKERFQQYSLSDQFKIFRFGVDKIEPPALDVADLLAEQGKTVVPFLVEHLNQADDLTVLDITLVFARMQRLKSYNVREDDALSQLLESKVARMKAGFAKDEASKNLERIKRPGQR